MRAQRNASVAELAGKIQRDPREVALELDEKLAVVLPDQVIAFAGRPFECLSVQNTDRSAGIFDDSLPLEHAGRLRDAPSVRAEHCG
jgi:hypothetical protein